MSIGNIYLFIFLFVYVFFLTVQFTAKVVTQ